MPELPEVETVRRGIEPHVADRRIVAVRIREPRLRRPVPARLAGQLRGQRVEHVGRRGKYLVLELERGHLLIHLGMSGSLRVLPQPSAPRKHDHLDIEFDNGVCLRFHDPRRFGSVTWTTRPPERHALLRSLGPEPLSADFDGAYLYGRSRGRRVAAKSFLMDGTVVAGVGNIYANEALYRAGIHPARPAGRIGARRYESLARSVRETLTEAIDRGGSTLRDFVNEDGRPGYFVPLLRVYDREGQACVACGGVIRRRVIGQRAAYYCPTCQR
ncbi:MAG: bifunctional DNA-formamidopyrimidine glycosylase/DNA-(apurinic or apyrimidinic site) lyase [Arenicellales bacterium]